MTHLFRKKKDRKKKFTRYILLLTTNKGYDTRKKRTKIKEKKSMTNVTKWSQFLTCHDLGTGLLCKIMIHFLITSFYLVQPVPMFACFPGKQILKVVFHPTPVIGLAWNLSYLCLSDDNILTGANILVVHLWVWFPLEGTSSFLLIV